MQIAGKVGAAELDDVRSGLPSDARSDVRSGAGLAAQRPTLSVGAQFRAAFRWLAVLTAVASIVAVLLVGAISMGCYAVAVLLEKIRPLRKAYQYISGVYDGLIERLGQKVLRDARDTPALRLMVSLTLTAVPIFVAQMILGKPRLWLVIGFYLSLYGVRFQRFVRMFSAKHLEAHRRHGYFSDSFHKVFGRYVEFFLGFLYGNVPELDRTVHVRLHHKENSGPDDTTSTIGYDRTNRLHFLWYLSDNFWTVLGLAPYAYFTAKGEGENRRRMLWGITLYAAYFAAVFIY